MIKVGTCCVVVKTDPNWTQKYLGYICCVTGHGGLGANGLLWHYTDLPPPVIHSHVVCSEDSLRPINDPDKFPAEPAAHRLKEKA